MRGAVTSALVAVCLAAAATRAQATPITYLGQLAAGIPVAGANGQAPGNFDNPVGADYWFFQASAGSLLTITGTRVDTHYDMAAWLFAGLYSDTDDFGLWFEPSDAGFLEYGDDQIDSPGPYGDPQMILVAPVTGFYTVAVTNFLSGPGGPPNRYTLLARGVPEPGTLLLLGTGLLGLVRVRSRAR